MKKIKQTLLSLALLGILLLPYSCKADLLVPEGMMLHAQQVLERYDAQGEPLLQYLELWMDGERSLQRGLGVDGQPFNYVLSSEDGHIAWASDTLKAERTDTGGVFLPDYETLKTEFTLETTAPGQTYAGRACAVVLLEDPKNEEDWLKLYLDDETGFVLFCEAPLFRLRTALLEMQPLDESRLTPPD